MSEEQEICIRCGERPVYTSPRGMKGKICAECFLDALAEIFIEMEEEEPETEEGTPPPLHE